MSRRYFVEPRASENYPWRFVDVVSGLAAGPVSIHKTKRQAVRAREDYKRMLRRDAEESKRRIARRIKEL